MKLGKEKLVVEGKIKESKEKSGLNPEEIRIVVKSISNILDNSDLKSLLSLLENQLDNIGELNLEGREEKDLTIHLETVNLIIKKLIENDELVLGLKQKLLLDSEGEIRELLYRASKVNPDILDENGIGELIKDMANFNKQNTETALTELLRKKRERYELLVRLYINNKSEINIDNLTPEELELLKPLEGEISEEVDEVYTKEEKSTDLTSEFK